MRKKNLFHQKKISKMAQELAIFIRDINGSIHVNRWLCNCELLALFR